MKKLFQIAAFVFVTVACQNKSSKNLTSGFNSLADMTMDSSFVMLGGEKQYVEILAKSRNNPILLFIHGGPGWPQTPQLRYFNSKITDAFTM